MGCNLSYMRRRMQLGAQPHKAKASGAVATFRTNLAAKLDSLFVDVTPVQDLHGQQYPYPPGGGKNLFNAQFTSATAQTYCNFDNGVYTVKTLPDANTNFSCGTIDLKAGVSYILNGGSRTRFRVYIQVEGTRYTSAGSDTAPFTPSADTTGTVYSVLETGATVGEQIKPMVRLATVSDASFVPYSNVCPITGWAAAKVTGTGKNLAHFEDGYGIAVDGSVVEASRRTATRDGIKIDTSKTYALSFDGTDYKAIYCVYNGATVVRREAGIISGSVLNTSGGTELRVAIYPNESSVPNATIATNHPQIEVGSTAAAYSAYTGTTAVIQFNQTLYGAKINWKGRKAVVTHALFEYAGETQVRSVTLNASGYYAVVITPSGQALTPTGVNGGTVSNEFVPGSTVRPGNAYVTGYGKIVVAVLYDQTITTRDAATTWFQQNPAQFLYKLETPVEIPLDLVDFVTVPGVNNVFADCGDVDLSYWTN